MTRSARTGIVARFDAPKREAMMRTISYVAFAAALVTAGTAVAMTDPSVGGAAMYPSKTIVQNASAAPNLTTLVAAVKAAGLVETLSGPGPFTVFAPTNDAFSLLPAGTVDTLVKPENKAKLTQILTYHVVAGRLTARDLKRDAKMGGSQAMLKTVEGGMLTVSDPDGQLMLTDAGGHKAAITTTNVAQRNGMVMIIDNVLMP